MSARFLTIALLLGLTAGTAQAETAIKFALDWKFEGPSAPYFLAIDKGYYAEEGLSVTIDSGEGSLSTIPRVATGVYELGFGDINSLVKFLDQNPDAGLKGIMMVYDKPPFAIISLAAGGIAAPADLAGKRLGAPAPDSAFAQWPIFVAVNEIDTSAIQIENVGFPVREPMLAAGQVDAIFGFSFSSYLNLKAKGVAGDEIEVMLMADHGLDLYGNTIFVNPQFAAENPEAVRGFVRATLKGWRDTVADPAAAIGHVIQRNDVAREEVELERLEMAIRDNVLTEQVAAAGMGDVDPARLASAIEQIGIAYDYAQQPAVEAVFTSEFLPPAAERMLQ